MSTKILTELGHAVPPAPRHSVTVHMGKWDTAEKYVADSASVIATFQNAYPRMKPHRDIANVGILISYQATLMITMLIAIPACRSSLEASWSAE